MKPGSTFINKGKAKLKGLVKAYQLKKNKRIPSLNPDLWGLEVNEKGHLVVGGCDVNELGKAYGTPLFIINEKKLRSNCRILVDSLKSILSDAEIYYSYKTNPVPHMLQIIHEENIGAEVVSDFELWLAFQLGVFHEKIIYNGPNKSIESLKRAVNKRIRLINLDSFHEIQIMTDLCKELDVEIPLGIRLDTGIGWTGKFGFSIDSGDAFEAASTINRTSGLKLAGVHLHIGSNISSLSDYFKALDNTFSFLVELRKSCGLKVTYLDIGGGFGVPTVKRISEREKRFSNRFLVPLNQPEVNNVPSAKEFSRRISQRIKDLSGLHRIQLPTVFMEPGRLISSSAMILLLQVGDIKARNGLHKVVFLDGGPNFAGPVVESYHEAFIVNRMREKNAEFYSIVGNLCIPGGFLYGIKEFPRIRRGDFLAIMDAGAYFTTNLRNFCFPKPAIAVASNREHRLVRQRETYEHMIRDDIPFDRKGSIAHE